MKRFGLALALSMALTLTIGAAAFAAPGDYDSTQTTSDKYTSTLDSTSGESDSTSWGLKNGLTNANQTGKNEDVNNGTAYGDVIKNVGGQRTHGEYANDTNSCASCHQTHTASGEQLLFKNGVYNTCTACHDGTLGFYNVYTPSNAGTFGGNPDKAEGNASVHMATGVMTVSAAPGGNHDSTDANTWGKAFDCSSCHAPHGSYSDRLLNYDPNGMNHTAATDANGNPTGGRLVKNATVALDSATGKYTAKNSTGATVSGPWLYGSVYGTPKVYYTQIRVKDSSGNFTYKYSSSKSWNDMLKVDYLNGYFTDPSGVLAGKSISDIQIDVAPVTVVKMNESQIGTSPSGIKIMNVTSYQSGVNNFCAACHTDYNSTSATTETGTFSKAFRHKITQSLKTGMIGEGTSMVCLTCHYAHGTDESIMKDAQNKPVTSPDVNASSALKRYTNMSVCWKCHTESHSDQLVNNNSYQSSLANGTAPSSAN